MPHSYVSNLMHCVFSTKERLPLITSELEARLWPYIGGIARENRMKAIAIGGAADHLHALLSLPSTISFAKAVQLIKGGSSKWIHDTFHEALFPVVRFADSNIISHARTARRIKHSQQTQLASAGVLDAMHLSFWQIDT